MGYSALDPAVHERWKRYGPLVVYFVQKGVDKRKNNLMSRGHSELPLPAQ